MTTIAAVQGKYWAVIGCDSRVTDDVGKVYSLTKENPKLITNGPYLLAAAGDVRAINILSFVFKPPVPPFGCTGQKLDKFISSQFIPELRKCYEDSGYGKSEDAQSDVIVLVNGTIYEIDSDYSWCHDSSGIYAIGTGSSYAIGSLASALSDGKRSINSVKARVKEAIAISCRYDSSSAEPIVVISQNK